MAPSPVARALVAAGSCSPGVKRALEADSPQRWRRLKQAPSHQAVGDAASPQLSRSDLVPRKYVALADVEDNYELLRVVIRMMPHKVPPVPFLHGVLERAHEMAEDPKSHVEIRKRSYVLKKLIQYVRSLWRRSENSRVEKIEDLKSLCRTAKGTRRTRKVKLQMKIDHSQFFDSCELVDLEQDTGLEIVRRGPRGDITVCRSCGSLRSTACTAYKTESSTNCVLSAL